MVRAFEIGVAAHEGQLRKSGEPYYIHPVRVAHGIAQLGLDTASIAAALLHDAVEDTELSVYEITEQFGREVALVVDGVTKLGKVPYLSRQEQQAESFRKMLLAMSQDIRVLIVKLMDRLDNMRTLGHMATEKRERIARETMQIYAPLAGRLGIEGLRSELQDLSLALPRAGHVQDHGGRHPAPASTSIPGRSSATSSCCARRSSPITRPAPRRIRSRGSTRTFAGTRAGVRWTCARRCGPCCGCTGGSRRRGGASTSSRTWSRTSSPCGIGRPATPRSGFCTPTSSPRPGAFGTTWRCRDPTIIGRCTPR